MNPVVYILKSQKNHRYYIGSTIDMDRRLGEHNTGQVAATKYITPLEIVFTQEFQEIREARQVEYQLKKKKSSIIIEKIIKESKIEFIV